MASDATSDDRSILAAELVLGLLEGPELVAARNLHRDDPAFAADVAQWESRFEALFKQWPEAAPPTDLSRRVLAVAGVGADNSNVVTRWKWATAISSIAAAIFGFLLITPDRRDITPSGPPVTEPRSASMAVAFSVNDGATVLPATIDLSNHEVRVPKGIEVPQGKVAQLWLIEGKEKPVSLGLFVPGANGLAASLTTDRPIAAGSVLAISIEPLGGSPTGLPTGPVVATGELTRV